MKRRREVRAALLLSARLGAAAAILVLAAIPIALIMLRVFRHGRLAGVDGRVARRLSGFAYQSSQGADRAEVVTRLGNWTVLAVVVVGVAGCLLAVRRRADALMLVGTFVTGIAVAAALKAVIATAKDAFVPPVAAGLDKSFPSGHAMNSAFLYGALLVVVLPALRPWVRVIAVGVTVGIVSAVAASRVALGYHYVSDVIAGLLFGTAWLAASVWAFSGWRRDVAPVQES
ncbi:MAG: phosphatase PAP2 family protein [Mycobacteriales bacterium]